eukprot:CAMPEP_0114421466 /NCGR_PEP_ID=MMETSP0103-20121206/5092_1 /TAXON_ID=37642 ORGANISM="Paraphysomonas imperforata, Strain PA2" /NCGR_SAMPLE_ID=MMETSP0103 /ASSEMBLY_ACC=CAM_ASM_000201 /LENGTH=342 /DNA_ID=CAMNT_0001589987 /DNA_START=61 /DNA_END=1089 /DNA_ORIENTATION=+
MTMLSISCIFFLLFLVAGGSVLRSPECDKTAADNEGYASYFKGLQSVYGLDDTIYKCYKDCGWPSSTSASNLPTLVVAVGLEAAGQKMWTTAVFDAVVESDPTICASDVESAKPYSINGDKSFPLLTSEELARSIDTGFVAKGGTDKCKILMDFSHSFPNGKKKMPGRVMRHGDLVNLQQLHGVRYNVKYLVILRNLADNAVASLSRQNVRTIDHSVRSIESSLVYLEAALAKIPCHQKFLAHFEKFRTDPRSFSQPLKSFLGLDAASHPAATAALDRSLSAFAKNKKNLPVLKVPRDVVGGLCSRKDSEKKCNSELRAMYDKFFSLRGHMWPTFAATASSS